jgi:hypothetical protein
MRCRVASIVERIGAVHRPPVIPAAAIDAALRQTAVRFEPPST